MVGFAAAAFATVCVSFGCVLFAVTSINFTSAFTMRLRQPSGFQLLTTSDGTWMASDETVALYGSLFEAYRPERRWFLAVDGLFMVGLAATVARDPTTHSECTAVRTAMAGLFGGYMAVLAALRPYHSRVWNGLGVLLAACNTAALGLAMKDMSSEAVWMVVAGACVNGVWTAVKLAFTLCTEAVEADGERTQSAAVEQQMVPMATTAPAYDFEL